MWLFYLVVYQTITLLNLPAGQMIQKSRLEPGCGCRTHADLLHRLQDLTCLFHGNLTAVITANERGEKKDHFWPYISVISSTAMVTRVNT